jgi:hypothetical protein
MVFMFASVDSLNARSRQSSKDQGTSSETFGLFPGCGSLPKHMVPHQPALEILRVEQGRLAQISSLMFSLINALYWWGVMQFGVASYTSNHTMVSGCLNNKMTIILSTRMFVAHVISTCMRSVRMSMEDLSRVWDLRVKIPLDFGAS